MLDGQGYDISCDLVMKVSVGGRALTTLTSTNKQAGRAACPVVCVMVSVSR